MHLIKVSPAIDKFYTYGDLTEDNILETLYDYQLAHHHPKHKSFFIVYSSSTCRSGNKALIIFNAHATIQFDTTPHIPTVDDLLDLVDIAVKELNGLLQQKLPNLTLGPVKAADTVKLLSACIATAYPR